jgi:hypothetical protein
MGKRISTTLMGLGRGISEKGVASVDTLRRADTLGAYHQAYSSKIGLIVCSGAFSKSMPTPPPEGKTEALAMADRLVGEWGVPASKIAVEDESQDTFYNLINSVKNGLFNGVEIDEEHPIGLGAGFAHGIRARLITRQALGVSGRAVRLIAPRGEFTPRSTVVELGGSVLTAMALHGAEPGNIEDTMAAAERFENLMSWSRNVPLITGASSQADIEYQQELN